MNLTLKRERFSKMYNVELSDYGYLVVSDGILNPEYLIPTFISFLSDYVETEEEETSLKELHAEFRRYAAIEYYEGSEYMAELYDVVFSMMEDITPENAYFGGSEDDPACIGFWMIGENEF